MTAVAVLLMSRKAGIVLEADGDRLIVEAPVGVMTDEWRATLRRHKPDLLARLRPPRFVTLRPDTRTGFAPTVPIEVVELMLDLERRGYRQTLDGAGAYQVVPAKGLTELDRAAIARWRAHLAVLVDYTAPEVA